MNLKELQKLRDKFEYKLKPLTVVTRKPDSDAPVILVILENTRSRFTDKYSFHRYVMELKKSGPLFDKMGWVVITHVQDGSLEKCLQHLNDQCAPDYPGYEKPAPEPRKEPQPLFQREEEEEPTPVPLPGSKPRPSPKKFTMEGNLDDIRADFESGFNVKEVFLSSDNVVVVAEQYGKYSLFQYYADGTGQYVISFPIQDTTFDVAIDIAKSITGLETRLLGEEDPHPGPNVPGPAGTGPIRPR